MSAVTIVFDVGVPVTKGAEFRARMREAADRLPGSLRIRIENEVSSQANDFMLRAGEISRIAVEVAGYLAGKLPKLCLGAPISDTDLKRRVIAALRYRAWRLKQYRAKNCSLEELVAQCAAVVEIVDPKPGPEDLALSACESDCLRAALAALDADLREMVVDRVCRRRPYADIAKAHGLTPNCVAKRIHSALRVLRKQLQVLQLPEEELQGALAHLCAEEF